MDLEVEHGSSLDRAKVMLVADENVDLMWPLLEKYLRFLEDDDPQLYTMQSLYSFVKCKTMQLWAVAYENDYKAALLTQVIEFPVSKVLEVIGFGGEGILKRMSDMKPVERWAEEQGCSAIRVVGREGWAKVLQGYGYNGTKVIISGKLGFGR